jgi:hypothetical protein
MRYYAGCMPFSPMITSRDRDYMKAHTAVKAKQVNYHKGKGKGKDKKREKEKTKKKKVTAGSTM